MGIAVVEPATRKKVRTCRPIHLVCCALACVGVACGIIGFAKHWHTSASLPCPVMPQEPTSATNTNTTTPVAAPPSPPPASRPLVMVIGDSLTMLGDDPSTSGWVAMLQHNYTRSVDFLNRGISGFTTQRYIDYAHPVISKELSRVFAPTLITLWYGTNDAALATGRNAQLHVPLETYRTNLIWILQQFQLLAPQAKLLLITPPPLDEEQRKQLLLSLGQNPSNPPTDVLNEETQKYAKVVTTQVAPSFPSVTVLDLFTFFMETYPNATDRAIFFKDGLHFSQQGNQIVFEQVQQKIEKMLPAKLLHTNQIWK